jgi:tetratricopeptide (TPR) repeat protein
VTRRPTWIRLAHASIVVCALVLWAPGCSGEERAAVDSTTLATNPDPAAESRAAAVGLAERADRARGARDYDEAISLYDQSIEADAGYIAAYLGKGWALLDTEAFVEAERWAESTTGRFPKSDIGWLQLGYANERLGDFEQAISAYERVLDLARPLAEAAGRAESGGQTFETSDEIGGGSLSGATMLDSSGLAESKTSLVASTERRVALLYYISAITTARESALGAENELTELAQSNADLPEITEQVRTVVERLRNQIDVLESIAPPDHFDRSHAEMIAAIQEALAGYESMAAALNSQSDSQMTEALERLEAARSQLSAADDLLRDLMTTYYEG